MRKIFLLVLIFCSFYTFGNPRDASTQPQPGSTLAQTAPAKDSEKNNSKATAVVTDTTKCGCKPHDIAPEDKLSSAQLFYIPAIAFVLLLLVVLVFFRNFLKEVLSENINDRVMKENPQYKELPTIISNVATALGPLAKELLDKANSAKDLAAKATENRENCQKEWENANQIVTVAGTNATEDQKKAATDAKAKYDAAKKEETDAINKADTSSKTVAAITLNPSMLVNLAGLFPPTIEVSKDKEKDETHYRPSASRMIAFISGLAMITVVICMACFYFYYYTATGCPPDLTSLSTVLLALGFGMAPYAINKVTNAATSKTI